jgi:hypothetical protein
MPVVVESADTHQDEGGALVRGRQSYMSVRGGDELQMQTYVDPSGLHPPLLNHARAWPQEGGSSLTKLSPALRAGPWVGDEYIKKSLGCFKALYRGGIPVKEIEGFRVVQQAGMRRRRGSPKAHPHELRSAHPVLPFYHQRCA